MPLWTIAELASRKNVRRESVRWYIRHGRMRVIRLPKNLPPRQGRPSPYPADVPMIPQDEAERYLTVHVGKPRKVEAKSS